MVSAAFDRQGLEYLDIIFTADYFRQGKRMQSIIVIAAQEGIPTLPVDI